MKDTQKPSENAQNEACHLEEDDRDKGEETEESQIERGKLNGSQMQCEALVFVCILFQHFLCSNLLQLVAMVSIPVLTQSHSPGISKHGQLHRRVGEELEWA